MKLHFLMFLIIINAHIPLVAMKRPAKKQLEKPTHHLPLDFLTGAPRQSSSDIPQDMLNLITNYTIENPQWWYTSTVLSNEGSIPVDVCCSKTNDVLACAFNPKKIILFNHHTNTVDDSFGNEDMWKNGSNKNSLCSLSVYSAEKIAAVQKENQTAAYDPHILAIDFHENKKWITRQRFAHEMKNQSPIAWSPNGKLLAVPNKFNSLKIYTEKKPTKYKESPYICHNNSSVNKIAWSPNNQQLAYALANKTVHIINITSQNPRHFIYTHPTDIATALTFNADGTQLSCAFFDNTIKTFNVPDVNDSHITDFAPYTNSIFYFDNKIPVWKLFYNKKNELMGWYLTYNKKNELTGDLIIQDEQRIETVNTVTNQKTLVFDTTNLPKSTVCLDFCAEQNNCVFGLEDGTIYFLKRYTNATPDQLFLHTILHLWYQVKKPSKSINDKSILLSAVAWLFKLKEKDLIDIWNSLEKPIRQSLWQHMNRMIQTYGK